MAKTSGWRICSKKNLWFNCSCGSTLMIPEDRYPWFSWERILGHKWPIFKTLTESNKLPHIPHHVMQLLQALQNENVTSKQIAQISKNDPFIASRILAMANNLKISSDSNVSTLEHAVSFIGLKALKDIIVTAALSAFKFRCKRYTVEIFWQQSLLVGQIAEHLARTLNVKVDPDIAYVSGSLCNIGKIVLAICKPDLADEIFDRTMDSSSPSSWTAAEAALSTYQHTTVGEIGALYWGLPEYISVANSEHHTYPETEQGIASSYSPLLSVVRFANQLAHWINLRPHEQDNTLLTGCRKYFGLSEPEVDKMVSHLIMVKAKIS
jgi:HD-like signal output (HDOD) protein